jgi:hypothetical protein
MDIIELADKIGGTYLANKVHVTLDGEYVVAAYFSGPDVVVTEAGRKALNRVGAEVAEPKAETPAPRATRRPRTKAPPLQPVVEPTVELPAEVELDDVQLSDE